MLEYLYWRLRGLNSKEIADKMKLAHSTVLRRNTRLRELDSYNFQRVINKIGVVFKKEVGYIEK